jgi:hypothetical protein
MPKKSTFGLLLASLFLMSACAKKNQNVIKGNISYIGAATGLEYVGAGATVYVLDCPTCTVYSSQTIADNNGDYTLTGVKDGTVYVYGFLEDSFGSEYDAISSSISVKKEDFQTLDLVLRY